MPTVIFRHSDGVDDIFEVLEGENLMRGAIDGAVEGVVGECGGALACATCHCYVEQPWADLLPAISEAEHDMLECVAAPRQPSSRLACQIEMSQALSGIVVKVPEKQF